GDVYTGDFPEVVITRHEIPAKPKPKIITTSADVDATVNVDEILKKEDFVTTPASFGLGDLPDLPDEKPEEFRDYTSEDPQFAGEIKQFYAYLRDNLRHPKGAIKEGTGRLSFIVGEQGKITGMRVVNGVNESLTKAAIEVLATSPRWNPGTRGGIPISAR